MPHSFLFSPTPEMLTFWPEFIFLEGSLDDSESRLLWLPDEPPHHWDGRMWTSTCFICERPAFVGTVSAMRPPPPPAPRHLTPPRLHGAHHRFSGGCEWASVERSRWGWEPPGKGARGQALPPHWVLYACDLHSRPARWVWVTVPIVRRNLRKQMEIASTRGSMEHVFRGSWVPHGSKIIRQISRHTLLFVIERS